MSVKKEYTSLILGGSFDPVHTGHLIVANEALQVLKAERVIFIPTGQNPLKERSPANNHDRLAMLQLATQDNPSFIISPIELYAKTPSFTVDTINELRSSGIIDYNSGFIIGDTQVASLPQWREYPKLFEEINLIIVRRSTSPLNIQLPVPYTLIENNVLDISSSDIRERIENDKSYRYLVPEAVYYYINDKGLYTCQGKK